MDPWWDAWTNQAELRPHSPEIHYDWAKWWDYDGGGLCFGVTGWGAHSYDQINRALGTDATGPVEVILEEVVADRDTVPDLEVLLSALRTSIEELLAAARADGVTPPPG